MKTVIEVLRDVKDERKELAVMLADLLEKQIQLTIKNKLSVNKLTNGKKLECPECGKVIPSGRKHNLETHIKGAHFKINK